MSGILFTLVADDVWPRRNERVHCDAVATGIVANTKRDEDLSIQALASLCSGAVRQEIHVTMIKRTNTSLTYG